MIVTVASPSGKLKLQARKVSPHFAIHASLNNLGRWTLTHIKSGYAARCYRTEGDAIGAALDLEDAYGKAWDFARVTPRVMTKLRAGEAKAITLKHGGIR